MLGRKVGESSSWTNPLEYPNECYTELARYAANAQLLGLVRGYENKVRFPHSIIQAYLGYRLLSEVEADGVAAVVEPALHSPGPSRELLIALVLLSRHRAAPPPQPAVRPDQGRSRRLLRGRRTPSNLAGLLRKAAANRHDAKYFDLYAAALEIDSVDPAPIQEELARDLDEQWADLDTKGDQRTVEDAKLGLVRRFGAALRERERRRGESGPLPGRRPRDRTSLTSASSGSARTRPPIRSGPRSRISWPPAVTRPSRACGRGSPSEPIPWSSTWRGPARPSGS
ncbi:hypothetical protein SHKM778_33940 [Streptomyces sp. KM77-8]|uniref:Uncharacterized protein n=1 Tax=Streptomyces haneummycinicus TaxID=3074435 RepID=A0AAT9HIA0_9ACTN